MREPGRGQSATPGTVTIFSTQRLTIRRPAMRSVILVTIRFYSGIFVIIRFYSSIFVTIRFDSGVFITIPF